MKALCEVAAPTAIQSMAVAIGIKRLAAMGTGQAIQCIAPSQPSGTVFLPPSSSAALAAEAFPSPGSRLCERLSAIGTAFARFEICSNKAIPLAEVSYSIAAQSGRICDGFIPFSATAQLSNLLFLPFGHKSTAPSPNDEYTGTDHAGELGQQSAFQLWPLRFSGDRYRVSAWAFSLRDKRKRAGIVLALSISGDSKYSTGCSFMSVPTLFHACFRLVSPIKLTAADMLPDHAPDGHTASPAQKLPSVADGTAWCG